MPIRIQTDAGECLRRRITQGLTQRQAVAKMTEHGAKISENTLRAVEQGKVNARPSTLKALAAAYGCDIADLIIEVPADESAA